MQLERKVDTAKYRGKIKLFLTELNQFKFDQGKLHQ